MMSEMDDVMVLESLLAERARKMQKDVLLYKEAALQPTGRWIQVKTSAKMMTEMDDVMVLESNLAARAREEQEALSRNGVFENSVVDSPASGVMKVTEQVVGMEISPPALTHGPLGDDMGKHGDRAQTESGQEEKCAFPTKPSEGGVASEVSSPFSGPNSGNFTDIAERTTVAQRTCRIRRKNWTKLETDELLEAVSNTPKKSTRIERGTNIHSHWDAIAEKVPGRMGHECRGRMDTLKRSFRTMKGYCDGHRKEFKQLNEKDFLEMKVSPRLTEAWYNQIRDCPPRHKTKLKTNGDGSSSKSTGFGPDTSTTDLPPPVFGEPALVWRLEYEVGIQQKEFVSTRRQGRSHNCDCNLNHTQMGD